MPTDVMAEIAVDSTPAGHAAPKRSIAHRVLSAVMTLVVLVLAAGFVIAAVAVTSGQWQAGPVVSGSMEPTIPTGGVVFTERVPVDDLAVGDIVMFQRPDEPDQQVVHRIIELEPSQHGPMLRTKGDANATADPWQVRPVGDNRLGRARIRPLRRVTWRWPPEQPSASTRSSRPRASSSGQASSCSSGGPRQTRKRSLRARHPRRDRVVTPGGPRLLRPPPTTVVQRMHHPPLTRSSNTMQFSNKKKAVAGAMIAVGGLALVGVGTGASFTDTVTANSTSRPAPPTSTSSRLRTSPSATDEQHRDPHGTRVFDELLHRRTATPSR